MLSVWNENSAFKCRSLNCSPLCSQHSIIYLLHTGQFPAPTRLLPYYLTLSQASWTWECFNEYFASFSCTFIAQWARWHFYRTEECWARWHSYRTVECWARWHYQSWVSFLVLKLLQISFLVEEWWKAQRGSWSLIHSALQHQRPLCRTTTHWAEWL